MTTQALQDNHLFQTGYLVNGIWKTLDTTFDVLNPATGEVIARVAKAGKAETEDAIAAAAKAGMARQNRERAFGNSLPLVRTDH